jgi:predicted thioesterase
MPSKRGIDRMQLKPGLVGTATLVVGEEHTAPHLGSGRAPVLASPIMIALMEAAAVDCVERLLPGGQESLGVHVEVAHTAPTPVGLGVTATAELKEVDGRRLSFDVEARDDRGVIGKGRHTRVIVDTERFRSKVRAKAAADG